MVSHYQGRISSRSLSFLPTSPLPTFRSIRRNSDRSSTEVFSCTRYIKPALQICCHDWNIWQPLHARNVAAIAVAYGNSLPSKKISEQSFRALNARTTQQNDAEGSFLGYSQAYRRMRGHKGILKVNLYLPPKLL